MPSTTSSPMALYYMTVECSTFHRAGGLGEQRGNGISLDQHLVIAVLLA